MKAISILINNIYKFEKNVNLANVLDEKRKKEIN